MRTLNGKFLAGLVATVVVLGVGVHLLHRTQLRRTAGALLAQADRAEDRGEPEKAADYLDRYLNLVPGDDDAAVRYGLLLASDDLANSPATRRQAISALERVLVRVPGRADVRRKLVDLAMDLGDVPTARTHLEVLLNVQPNDGGLEYQLGQCLESLGQLKTAAEWYGKAKTHAKDKVDAYTRLAAVLRKLGQATQADQVMDAVEVKHGLIAANGQSFRAYLARAAYRKANGLAGADQDVARALELAPDEQDALTAAAEAAEAAGDLKTAKTRLLHALERDDQDVRTYQALATLDARAGRPEKAVAWLEQALEKRPDQDELRWRLADLLLKGDDFERAEPLIASLRKEGVAEAPVNYLDAQLLSRRGRWADAAAQLATTAPDLGPELSRRAYILLGECYDRTGDAGRRYTAYRQAASVAGTDGALDLPVQLRLAASAAATNRIDEAIQLYRDVQRRPDAPSGVPLALAKLLVLKARQSPPEDRPWDAAERAIAEAREQAPSDLEPLMVNAEILADQGKLDEARLLVLKARELDPKQAAPWTALAAIDQKAGRADQALQTLDEADETLKRPIETRLARVRYWADFQGGAEKAARELAALAQGADALPSDDRARLLDALAAAYAKRGDLANAQPLWNQLAADQPANLAVRFTLLEAALQQGDLKEAERLVAAIRNLEGQDGVLWRFGRANLLILKAVGPNHDQSGLDEALELLAEAARKRPDWFRIPGAEGTANDLKGRTSAALKSYQRAIDLGDRGPRTIQRACQILAGRKRYAEAEQVLQKLDPKTLTADLQRLAAELSLQNGAYAQAVEQAREAVTPNPENASDADWLGRVLWNAAQRAETDGRRDEAALQKTEAGRQFRKAVELAGKAPGPWISLVQYLAAAGRNDEVETTIDQARKAVDKDLAHLIAAQCHEAAGQARRASEAYQEALRARPDDPAVMLAAVRFQLRQGRLAEAEPLLRKLEAVKDLPPEAAASIRRTLAFTLAAGGNPERSARALELLGDPAKGGPGLSPDAPSPIGPTGSGLADQRTRARVLAMQKDRAHRKEAIAVLESLMKLDDPEAEDRFLLAQLYEADGDWRKSQRQMQDLLASDGKNAGYLAYHTRALLRHGQHDEAGLWLGRLEQLQPKAPATLELQTRMLKAKGQGGDAAALLKAGVSEKTLDLLPVAALLEELGQFADSEAVYRQYVSETNDPTAPLTLAGFLGRRNRSNEALDLCEAAWKTCPPEAVANVCVAVLYSAAPAGDALCRRAADQLRAAAETSPDLAPLQFGLANIFSLQRRYDDAEAIYRTLNEKNKNQTAALNNLAWLLAMQGDRGAEALDLIQRAIQKAGASPDLLDTRATVYLSLGQPEKAVKDLEDVVAAGPSAEAHFHLALAYLKTGKRTEARETFREALAQGLAADGLHPLERPSFDQLNRLIAAK